MSEVEVNGTDGVDLDISTVRGELSSSSTHIRIASLKIIEERLSKKGMETMMPEFLVGEVGVLC